MNDKKNKMTLSPRLTAAASLVRQGSIVADVGTDHAYIPIYLVQNGISPFVIASDINHGPADRAAANIRRYGLTDRIKVVVTDGLRGIEAEAPQDILICGMGGELIAAILEAAPFVFDKNIRLILQPMTMQAQLRAYLCEKGLAIISESLTRDEGKIYQCICAEYDGIKRSYTPLELMIGRYNLDHHRDAEEFREFTDRMISVLKVKISGMERGGQDAAKEKALLSELNAVRNEINETGAGK